MEWNICFISYLIIKAHFVHYFTMAFNIYSHQNSWESRDEFVSRQMYLCAHIYTNTSHTVFTCPEAHPWTMWKAMITISLSLSLFFFNLLLVFLQLLYQVYHHPKLWILRFWNVKWPSEMHSSDPTGNRIHFYLLTWKHSVLSTAFYCSH